MRKPSIYVASAFVNKDIVSAYLTQLRGAGFHVTHDWTAPTEHDGRGELELNEAIQSQLAADDARGVVQADIFWLISPEKPLGTGCWVELGLAVATSPCFVIVSGPPRSIFQTLCQARFDTHDEAFQAILGGAGFAR